MAADELGHPRRARLGLRGRLVLFFVVIVLVPLTIGLVVLSRSVRGSQEAAMEHDVAQTSTAAGQILDEASLTLDVVVDAVVSDATASAVAAGDVDALEGQLQEDAMAAGDAVDFMIATDPNGGVLGAVWGPPEVADRAPSPTVEDIAAAVSRRRAVSGALLVGRELKDPEDATVGFVAAGRWLDGQTLETLPRPAGGGVATLGGDRVWASAPAATPDGADALDPASMEPVGRDGWFRASTAAGGSLMGRAVDHVNVGADVTRADVVVWAPADDAGDAPLLMAGIVVAAGAVAAVAGWLLAGSIIAPVGRAVEAASAIAAGHLSHTVPISGGGRELDELADALNAMNAQLADRVDELEDSKEELRRSLSRLGETLSSSLDLDRTLVVVTETAMETLSADQAVLMLFTPERDALYAKVGRGIGTNVPRLRPGQGRLGWVAATGLAAHVTTAGHGDGLVPSPDEDEPAAERQLLVPLVGRGETLGVLSLTRAGSGGADFREDDLETLQSFAAQAAVALENVLLHEDAQRRSLTDPLTGLWNFRHFEAQAAREFESAMRFDRPLSLLVLDVDHFKQVNDRLGHQAGDEVLREIARRIRESARAPDIVARYGGEEFVVLLPGADAEGAHITAERMRMRLSSTRYAVDAESEPVRVTCSIGVASAPAHATDAASLLRRGDEALYRAKEAGRNRVVVSGTALSDTTMT